MPRMTRVKRRSENRDLSATRTILARYNPSMPDYFDQPRLEFVAADARDTDCDLIAVPISSEDDLDDVVGAESAFGGALAKSIESGEFGLDSGDTVLVERNDSNWKTNRVLFVLTDTAARTPEDRLRKAAAVAARYAIRHKTGILGFVCRGCCKVSSAAQSVSEGLLLGGFEDRRYRTKSRDKMSTTGFLVIGNKGAYSDGHLGVERGSVLGASTNIARLFTNEPANLLPPDEFALRARDVLKDARIEADILDERDIERLGLGLLLGVSLGSKQAPRVLVMRNTTHFEHGDRMLALVGKGVTFDSGGLSLKTPAGMEIMKRDMAGGAAVISAMRAIGLIGLDRPILGIVPMTENMPGGMAMRPGDVLTSGAGTTVEVINTDAEGRLILGDALWYARQLGATHLIDVATLTGACKVALGTNYSGLFGESNDWVKSVLRASEKAGELVWRLPTGKEFLALLKSDTADIANSGGRVAGASSAAMFLEHFSGGLPWAHIDIAGTAWNEEAREGLASGATGVMVRTLVEIALDSSAW